MKNLIKTIVFLLILIGMISIADRLYNPAGTMGAWYQSNAIVNFYKKDKDTIDVIYIGDSNVYAGISPLEIYDRTGITGYSYSTPNQKVWSSYYMLKEIYKNQSPKIIFLETNEFFVNSVDDDEISKRNVFDTMKLGKNKLDMINDKVYHLSIYEKLGCIFPVIRYHSRWSKLNEYDIRKFVNTDYLYEGFSIQSKIEKASKDENKKKNKNIKTHKEAPEDDDITLDVQESMQKIIELCKQHNTELVLIKMPEAKGWDEQKSNKIQEYADINSLKFIDLNYDDDIDIDWNVDSQDSGEHLNIYGAEKVGEYLANYLKNNFNSLVDHRNDSKYYVWNNELVQYKKGKEEEKGKSN